MPMGGLQARILLGQVLEYLDEPRGGVDGKGPSLQKTDVLNSWRRPYAYKPPSRVVI